jgi:PAS domain S-box-containing protein
VGGTTLPVSSATAVTHPLIETIATSTTTGQAFLELLVQGLSKATNATLAIVGAYDAAGQRMLARAAAARGELVPPFEYNLAGTPCANVVDGDVCYYPNGVATLFPEDAALTAKGIESYLGAPVLGSDGTPIGLIVLLHDRPLEAHETPERLVRLLVHRVAVEFERENVLRQLRQQAERYRQFSELTSEFIFEYTVRPGESHRFEAFGAFERLVGCDAGTFMARGGVREVIHPDDLAPFERFREELHDRGLAELEMRIFRPDGALRWVRAVAQCTHHADSGCLILGGVQNITEQKRLQADLLHSQRLETTGRLAGGVSHDFNNLLTAIMGEAQIGLDELPADHPATSSFHAILETTERARAVTSQLLALARKQTTAPRVIEPAARLHAMVPLLRRLLGERVRLELEVNAPAGNVYADPSRIEQVLVNLVVNGRDAMPRGGTLTVVVEPARDPATGAPQVAMRVRDTGVGIAEDNLSLIFEPFFSTKGSGGTGLGLATCREIVEEAGGRIEVRSSVGVGSEFSCYFPATEAQPEHERSTLRPLRAQARGRVLVVEDDALVRSVVARTLRAAGFDVTEVVSLATARAVVASAHAPFRFVVTDNILTDGTGTSMIGWYRREAGAKRVIVISGYIENQEERETMLKTADAFLPKPFLPSELVDLLLRLDPGPVA